MRDARGGGELGDTPASFSLHLFLPLRFPFPTFLCTLYYDGAFRTGGPFHKQDTHIFFCPALGRRRDQAKWEDFSCQRSELHFVSASMAKIGALGDIGRGLHRRQHFAFGEGESSHWSSHFLGTQAAPKPTNSPSSSIPLIWLGRAGNACLVTGRSSSGKLSSSSSLRGLSPPLYVNDGSSRRTCRSMGMVVLDRQYNYYLSTRTTSVCHSCNPSSAPWKTMMA